MIDLTEQELAEFRSRLASQVALLEADLTVLAALDDEEAQ